MTDVEPLDAIEAPRVGGPEIRVLEYPYFLAENLAARAGEFAARIQSSTGAEEDAAAREVEASAA